MTLPGTMVKNKKPIVLALPAELAAVLKKQFRKVGEPIFDCTNVRRERDKAASAAGYPTNLIVHDLRLSRARNLREAGVDETVITKIGGRKTRSVFVRHGIVTTKDIENAMDLLQKNNGTLMEPDRNPAQR
jgi:integrase